MRGKIMEKKINVAIIGAGNIAEAMANALKGINNRVNLYAVASRSIDKATRFAEKYGFEKAYGSYEELAKDESADLIYIATPHSEHFKNAMLCVENGRNCLVEKAFCGNQKQSIELINAAKNNNVLLAEAMWTRYQPSKDVIKAILREGKLGNIISVQSDFSVPIIGKDRLVNPALAGGALLDLGVYSLTVPDMFVDSTIKGIKQKVVKTETGVDATTVVQITYTNGVVATCKCSSVDANSNYAKIVCENGSMEFYPINVPKEVKIYNKDGILTQTIETSVSVNGYEYEVIECVDAILEGKTQVKSMPLSETIRIMGWMDSIRNHAGIVYPFETKKDIELDLSKVWGPDFVSIEDL